MTIESLSGRIYSILYHGEMVTKERKRRKRYAVFYFILLQTYYSHNSNKPLLHFKLQEFIKRGNYGKALRESRELVSRVRNLKTRMDDFMLRCRTNISEVSIDEYEEIEEKKEDYEIDAIIKQHKARPS